MIRIPLYLLLLIMPLAVAGQNIGTGVIGLMLFAQIWMRRRELPVRELWARYRVPFVLSLAFIAVLLLASAVNPANPDRFSASLVFGYAIWALLPPVTFLAQPALSAKEWDRLLACLALVCVVWGGVALSQNALGWRIVGSHFTAGPTRAQAFYSHPLTFAYAALTFFPLACLAVARWPRKVASWALLVGLLAALYGSQSRMAQGVAALAVVFNVVWVARGKARWALIGAMATVALVTAVTDNPVRTRLAGTLERHDVRSDYPDDRLAFWHANWEMVKERPLLGHGDHLDTKYRAPYYEKIGLPNFVRMYEAHNQYLQVLVNAGIVGLVLFLAWLGWYFRLGWRERRALDGQLLLQTLGTSCLAAVSQNAFQDAEVRYALTLVCVATWLAFSSAAPRAPRA